MTEGKVKFFNQVKNFGFIAGDDGKEYFVHGSAVEAGVRLNEGDRVTFNGVTGDRGLKAEHVRKAGAEPARKPVEDNVQEETDDQPSEDTEDESDEE